MHPVQLRRAKGARIGRRHAAIRLLIPLMICLCLTGAHPAACAEPPVRDADNVVLTARDIAALQVRSVQELLNLIPGVQAGSSSVAIRGSYKVRVLLDGMTLNDPGTFSVNLDLIPFRDLDRVEIFKGGGGVVFGDDASGGAVVFTTKRLEKTDAFVEAAGGSHDTFESRFNLTRRKDGLGLGLGGEFRTTQGYRTNNDKEEKRLGGKISFRPSFWGPDREPTLSVEFSQTDQGFAGLPAYPTPNSRGVDESLGASFTWQNWGITSGTFLTRFEQERTDPDKDSHTLMRTTNLKQQLARSWEVWGLSGINTGLDAETTWAEGSELDPTQESALGIYASKRFSFQQWLPVYLRLGLRANLYSAFDNVINPEAELGLDLGGHHFKLAFSRSNNLPSIRQRHFRYSSMEPNPDLVMEKATNLTLGVSSKWTDWLSSDVSLFNRDVEDRITYVYVAGGVGQYQNFGSTLLRGVDLSLDFKPFPWLSLKPSYTYLEATDTDTGLWLSCKPRHKIKADLRIKPLENLSLGIFYKYESMRYTRSDNTESASPYYTVDLRADWDVAGFRVFATWENLMDEQYIYGDGYPAPPRMWLVGLSREF